MSISTLRRRSATLAAAMLSAALMLTGCGSSDNTSTPSESKSSASTPSESSSPTSTDGMPAAEGKTQYPLTLKSEWGETTLDERPLRIAAVTANALDVELLASLGVVPVLASARIDAGVWTVEALPTLPDATFEPVGGGSGNVTLPFEEIAAVKPDLILALDIDDAKYDRLSQIAPVVAAGTAAQQDSDWRAYLDAIGEAVDLSSKADDVESSYDTYFTEFAAEHPDFQGKTVTQLVYFGQQSGLNYNTVTGGRVESFFLSLGFDPNPLGEQFVAASSVSLENLSQVDADVIVLSAVVGGDPADITDNELWKGLTAVKNGAVVITKAKDASSYEFDGKSYDGNLAWAMGTAGPLGRQWAAERLGSMIDSVLK
ncbi:MAG: ABC transporter substrate-binding protein [Ancrocorticia sp.]